MFLGSPVSAKQSTHSSVGLKQRKANRKRDAKHSLTLRNQSRSSSTDARPRDYSRKRAACLIGIHLLFILHILHWKLAGRTLAPLELNEVMYTLEIGIVTAGFVFMTLAVLGTIVFGRFFCSWGCHILALEDLCAWLLGKLRIRPKPIRARLLLLVPPLAMLYMFVWPQITRWLDGRPMPVMHLRSDTEGWASFVTSDFWRNLPGPGMALLTFAMCGFAIVYLLGSRAFCTYICPYGAAFGLADRFAPGRIVARGDCSQCGICTAICQSRVRVHEELATYGKVVNPSCLKDLDCVAACPNGAVSYGLARPPILESLITLIPGRSQSADSPPRLKAKAYDFTIREELLIALIFLASFLVYRGLYHRVPFLLALAIGAMMGYIAVLAIRLFHKSHVKMSNLQLKIGGRLTRSGWAFCTLAATLFLLTLHSGYIRYHERYGARAYELARCAAARGDDVEASALATPALAHLERCERWGLYQPAELSLRLGPLYLWSRRPTEAEPHLRRARLAFPGDSSLPTHIAATHFLLGQVCADRGDLQGALHRFREATRWSPNVAEYHYNLAVILGVTGATDDAVIAYESALRLQPDDVDTLNNLGLLLAQRGQLDAGIARLQRAIEIQPASAHPHFNLGRILTARGQAAQADRHFREAARLDPAYAKLLLE